MSKYKLNRQGELFTCRKCHASLDADHNAAKNILSKYQEFIVPDSGKVSVNIC